MPVFGIPALGLLWPGLVLAYLGSTTMGHVPAALAVLGLIAGTIVVSLGRPLAGLIVGVVLAVLAWRFAAAIPFLVYLPPLVAFAFMAIFFGRTLRAGSEPLIARISRKEHPVMTPEVARHTRALTMLWSACFALLFLVTLLLAPLLPLNAWSRWVQVLGMIVPVVLFFGEYIYRRYQFPDRTQGSLYVMVGNVIAVFQEMKPTPERNAARGGEPQ
jgi:uncharacterized membrane protein